MSMSIVLYLKKTQAGIYRRQLSPSPFVRLPVAGQGMRDHPEANLTEPRKGTYSDALRSVPQGRYLEFIFVWTWEFTHQPEPC